MAESHPFALEHMKTIHTMYEFNPNENEKRHLFKTVIYSLNKIVSFGIKTTWLWLPVLVRLLIIYWDDQTIIQQMIQSLNLFYLLPLQEKLQTTKFWACKIFILTYFRKACNDGYLIEANA